MQRYQSTGRRAKRAAPAKRRPAGGNYFPEVREAKRFIPTGCTLLDCILGGGWVLGRVANIVGDKSTGKTLLAVEACANFARAYPRGKIYYREAESAFDLNYAVRLGLPINRVDFGPKGIDSHWRTVEEIFEDLREVCAKHARSKQPGLYIVDSLDALTSEQALSRKIREGSYNLEKQKILSLLFQQMITDFKASNLGIIIVSQVRDKIGFTIGEKQHRSGGKSLDFYATHIVWLHHMKTLVSEVHGEKRATGIRIQAKCKKNKISEPFRNCTFPIRFGFGIDDVEASLIWLAERNMHNRLGIKNKKSGVDDYLDEMSDLSPAEYAKRAAQIRDTVLQGWKEVEGWFTPSRRKYEATA